MEIDTKTSTGPAQRMKEETKTNKSEKSQVNSFHSFLLNQLVKEANQLYKGSISFTHFIALESDISVKKLADLWNRCAAAILKKNSKGSDLLIPVRLEDLKFGAIVIQVYSHCNRLDDNFGYFR